MPKKTNDHNPVCPKCGERTTGNGSVRGRKRYKCIKCKRSFGKIFSWPLAYSKNSLEEIIISLQKVRQEGSFNSAERLTGHKNETLTLWLRKLYDCRYQLPTKVLTEVGIEENAFVNFLEEYYKKLTIGRKRWTNSPLIIEKAPIIDDLLLQIEKATSNLENIILKKGHAITVKDVHIKDYLTILYEPLWKKIITPSESLQAISEKLLSEIDSSNKDLMNKFIQTLPALIVILELSGKWSEAMEILDGCIKIPLVRRKISNDIGIVPFMDSYYMKKSQFLHKRNPRQALELARQREIFQKKYKLNNELINTWAWKVLFLLRSGRIEKELEENIEKVKVEYPNTSLFPRKLFARYYSLKMESAGRSEKFLLRLKLEQYCDSILDFLNSKSVTEREIAQSYVDIAQYYQNITRPNKDEIERLTKAANISVKFGYAGQATQLLKLIKARRFMPDKNIYTSLQGLSNTIKSDTYYIP